MNGLTELEQFILDNNRVWPFNIRESVFLGYGSALGYVTKVDFLKRIAEENRPAFEGHKDAKCFVCNSDGLWNKNKGTHKVRKTESGWTPIASVPYPCVWVRLQKGKPIGGWKESLMVRPKETPEDKWVPEVGDVCVMEGVDFTIDFVGTEKVFGHYKLGFENQYRISNLVKKEPKPVLTAKQIEIINLKSEIAAITKRIDALES